MKKCFQFALLKIIFYLSVCAGTYDHLNAQNLTKYVNPLIGSGGHGHVFVGASVPFGAVQIGPNNIYKGWDWCSGYHYSDSLIIGFSQLHLSGTGIGDLADVLMMPITGEVKLDKGRQEYPHNGYLSTFSHKNEISKPGFYSVKLDNGVAVELTATERVGFHQHRFPKSKDAHVMIDLKEGINDQSTDTYLEQTDEYTLKGYRFSSGWAKVQKVFFAIRSSKPINKLLLYDDVKSLSGNKGKGKAVKGVIKFNQGDFVQLKVGISPVSADNALANINAEVPAWNFNEIVKQADTRWNKELSRIKIETKNEADKRIFYTAMFHSLIHPSLFNDHNGDFPGTNNKINNKQNFNNYSVFSTWDTYRAEHSLLTLIAPDRVNDFINSILAINDEQGHMPIWHLNGFETECMPGISSMQIVAEAYLKGFRGFDAEKAYQSLKKTAMSDLRGLNYLRDFKAIPSDVKLLSSVPSAANSTRTVAQTMELSISDGSLALMAKALGKNDDYTYFSKRAKNYQLFYDPAVGFFRGIKSDGTRNPVFDPIKSKKPWSADYAEGNAWQYLWMAPHDVPGLINFLGGNDKFNARLDSFFVITAPDTADVLVDLTGNIGQYAHGNEPSYHNAYMYAYSGQQWKTAEKVRFIMKEFYHDDPDGIIGNEDCGQMSAWYIFSSLGFYPVFPASGEYVMGSPLFDKATINLPNGKKFSVEVVNNNAKNINIQQVELNGQKSAKGTISHEDILKGGVLKISMGNSPNRNFSSPM